MSTYVLDASALLTALLGEPGAERVEALLPRAVVGAVNLGEVVAKLAERGVPDEEITAALAALDLEVVPFDRAGAIASGLLRTATKAAGLSFGDRACLALAASRGAVAVTADRSWAGVEVGVRVEVVR